MAIPAAFQRREASSSTNGERKTSEMPGILTTFIENIWDEEDFEESLIAFEGVIGKSFLPNILLVRQLFALALSPSACLPPLTKASGLSRRLHPSSSDPFDHTERKVRQETLRLLEDLASTSTIEPIARALPGYEPDQELAGAAGASLKAPDSPKKGKKQAVEDDEEGNALWQAGLRVARLENLWLLLGEGIGRGKAVKSRSREEPVVLGGWDLLRSLVGMWEEEAALRSSRDESAIAASLLRQFKPSQTGPRDVSAPAFDVVFWPFSGYSSGSNSDADEGAESEVDHDEMPLGEKQEVAIRLLKLLAGLAVDGRVQSPEFLRELVSRLNSINVDEIDNFLALFRGAPPLFVIRFCTTYLTTYSHDANPVPAALANVSPRRKALNGASASSASLSQGDSSSLGSIPLTIAYYHLPDTKTVISLLEKVPSAIPSSASLGSAPSRKNGGPRKSTSSFASAARAAKMHELVKLLLLEVVLETAESQGLTRVEEALVEDGLAAKALDGVVAQVEQARATVEAS